MQTRVLSNGTPRYDKVLPGYAGELWLEIVPKSFDIVLRAGDSLNQAIFYEDRRILSSHELERLHATTTLLRDRNGTAIDARDALLPDETTGALHMTLDLDQDVVGWVAKKSFLPIDLSKVAARDPSEFFDPIERPKGGALFLSKEAFYIFSTTEYLSVPTAYAVEMLPYDTSAGEFRAHYAGFFDPGFGYGRKGEILGTPAVLEVRPHEDDLIVRHRQPVCKMAFECLTSTPDTIYGVGAKSNYATQRGPRLSKFFRDAGVSSEGICDTPPKDLALRVSETGGRKVDIKCEGNAYPVFLHQDETRRVDDTQLVKISPIEKSPALGQLGRGASENVETRD